MPKHVMYKKTETRDARCDLTSRRRLGIFVSRGGILVFAFTMMGCDSPPTPTTDSPQENNKVTTLTISKRENGSETLVGKLVFEEGKEPRLVTQGEGPDAQALRSAWQELAKQDKLPMSTTETTEVNGEKVTEFGERLVPKGDNMYPKAVWNELENKHRYIVDRE